MARIGDVKDFRVRTFMVQLGLDPSQPSLLYRLFIKDSRIAVALDDQVRSLERRCRELEAECGRLAAEKIDTERALNERQAGLSEEIRSLQAVNTGLQSRLRRAQEDIARARAVARDPDEKIAAIVSLLKGSDDLRTLESILDLALKACSVAADERVGWASRIDLAQQTFRVLELRQWLRNQLRPALEPSEEERILVEYKIRIHGKACVVCASSLCEEGEIIAWAHDRCTRRER